MRRARLLLLVLCCIGLTVSGCQDVRAVPTVANIDALSTEVFLTEQAPPPAFQTVSFERIEAGLSALPAWHATVTLTFDGTYTGSTRQARGSITVNIYTNELSGEKRVVLRVEGEPFGSADANTVEGVRIGNAYYLVNQNKICRTTSDPGSERITELMPSFLIGGIRRAQFTYNQRQINGWRAWEYAFAPGSVVPPPVAMREGGTITIASGTFWVAPEVGAVVDYQITYNLTNGSVQDSQPLTGQLRVQYELKEAGTLFNIAIPFGC